MSQTPLSDSARLRVLREWMRETDWLHFCADHPGAAQWFDAAESSDFPFGLGDLVRKIKGSAWEGRVVGTYSTALTSEGYCVESSAHPGSVQIYPRAALERVG